jgi:hypothetical protein
MRRWGIRSFMTPKGVPPPLRVSYRSFRKELLLPLCYRLVLNQGVQRDPSREDRTAKCLMDRRRFSWVVLPACC